MKNEKDITYVPLEDTASCYYTHDISTAATLVVGGFEMLSIDKPGGGQKARFIFRRNHALDKEVKDFWEGRARVNPQQFMSEVKNLKSRITNEII